MMFYAVYGTLGATINNLVAPYGFTAMNSSLFGATFIMVGLVSSIIVGGYVDSSKKFLRTFRILCFASLIVGSMVSVTI